MNVCRLEIIENPLFAQHYFETTINSLFQLLTLRNKSFEKSSADLRSVIEEAAVGVVRAAIACRQENSPGGERRDWYFDPISGLKYVAQ